MANLDTIVERMKSGSVTEDWGALSVFNRTRLNRLLEQQYIQRFENFSFLPAFIGTFQQDENGAEDVALQNIELGTPLLSFESASLVSSQATLTMNIVGGRLVRQQAMGLLRLPSVQRIIEADGYKLYMDIDLSLVVGEVDRHGKVTLDLSKAANFRCDLLGPDDALQQQLGNRFKQYFEALPANRSVFVLGMLDVLGYNPLTPASFRIYTQAAPGAKVRAAANYGDGVVLVFIRLKGNTSDGRPPLEATFPYLMPDNQEAGGGDLYSAVMVLSHDMLPHATDERLDLINRLLFPGGNVFQERVRETPYDLAVFGSISPTQTSLSLSPLFKTISSGQTQQFSLRKGNGSAVTASAWKVLGLECHATERQGSISTSGLYTAPTRALIGRDMLRVVVTAEYVEAGITYSASALVFVVFESLAVWPRTALQTVQRLEPLRLSSSSSGAVSWRALEPVYGSVRSTGSNSAEFTPDSISTSTGLVVQQIEATHTDNSRVQSALIVESTQQLLGLSPAIAHPLASTPAVQLSDDRNLLPNVPRRWKVISGDGTVDGNGRFSAPGQRSTSTSVVQCDMVRNGILFGSGYSVIELVDLEPEPVWKALSKFEIRVPGFGDGSNGSLYGNGYQQLQVEVTIETQLVDGKSIPLSPTEKSSLVLVETGGQEVPFVDEGSDGMPETDDKNWRTNREGNDFVRALPRGGVSGNPHGGDALEETQKLFLHSRAHNISTFHAMFRQDPLDGVDGLFFRSTEYGTHNDKIEVAPITFPPPGKDDYQFVRVRTEGGSGAPGDPEEDDFDFHLVTEDYWKLNYPPSPFVTAEFISVEKEGEANISSIRWESGYVTEKMFSWTGYVFKDPIRGVPDKVQFDVDIWEFVYFDDLDTAVKVDQVESGQIVFVLRRSDNVRFIEPGDPLRDKLDNGMSVLLRDKNGNAHKRRIQFLPSTQPGDRNRLEHLLF